MQLVRPNLPTVLSAFALATALAGYLGPHAGSAATVTPAPLTDIRAVQNRPAIDISPAARIKALEAHSDEMDAKVLRLERELAGAGREIASLKSHQHPYTPMPGYGIVNLPTFKQMLDRMSPSDMRSSIPIAWDGVRQSTHLPQTGSPVSALP
jgi:hypothetical protein